jgi:hypothetical protein
MSLVDRDVKVKNTKFSDLDSKVAEEDILFRIMLADLLGQHKPDFV